MNTRVSAAIAIPQTSLHGALSVSHIRDFLAYLAIDRDRARAGRRLVEWFAAFYGRAEMASLVSVFGGPQEVVDGLAEVVRGGAQYLLLNPVLDEREHLEQLASEIMPAL